ncbi:MAG: DsbA family protein [Candidatus Levybacteria bacterium]|nr:DsbA family protein [Candidatus Levybacteria bacterium]
MKKEISSYYTPVLVILLIVAAFFVGIFWTKSQYLEQKQAPVAQANPTAKPNQPQALGQKTVNVDVGHFPPLGNKNAKITIVEFADFQCPFCERLYTGALADIKKEYIDKGLVKLYYRNYAFLGAESTNAAEASECANEQGKFWEMHDYLFNHQGGENLGAFSKENLKKFAKDVGLDTGKFNSCLDSDKYKDSVAKDLSDGKAAGVTGTPATFVNGQIVVGAQPFESFKTIIDQELKK